MIRCANFKSCLFEYWKTLAVNAFCSLLLVIYATFGAIIFLYFEVPFSHHLRQKDLLEKTECVVVNIHLIQDQRFLSDASRNENFNPFDVYNSTHNNAIDVERREIQTRNRTYLNELIAQHVHISTLQIARKITNNCVLTAQKLDERSVWNLKNAFLFSFGIMTTLGYGKIEPQTENGRIFTVVYGFIGVPFTVILLTNFMRYLLNLERAIRKRYYVRQRRRLQEKKERLEARTRLEKITVIGADGTFEHYNPNKNNNVNSTSHYSKIPEFFRGNNERNSHKRFKDDEKFDVSAKSTKMFGEKVDLASIVASLEEFGQISMCTLICIVFIYMLFGGILMWLMAAPSTANSSAFMSPNWSPDSTTNFLNGIYYSFIALIHIEYGNLVPESTWWIPIVMSYVCLGLSISAIALRVGSAYVKRLYYYGRKIGNIAGVKIRFGAKNLQVRELLTALGHNIGLEPTILFDLDLEKLVANAIEVKEGRMERVPQTYMIVDGIWPPELVPLFIKDGGNFPLYVDAEEAISSERRGIGGIWSSFRNSLRSKSTQHPIGNSQQYRRHSSASLLPFPRSSLLRQKLSWIRKDANNNDESAPVSSYECQSLHGRNGMPRKIGLRLLTDWEGPREADENSAPNSIPPSVTPSPAGTRRAPPPFLFQKPSVRFHDIIYNNWTSTQQNDAEKQYRRSQSYRYHQYNHNICEEKDNQNMGILTSRIFVNPMVSSHREVVRTLEKETYNVQFIVPSRNAPDVLSSAYSELLNKHPSLIVNDNDERQEADNARLKLIDSDESDQFMESKTTFTEVFQNFTEVQRSRNPALSNNSVEKPRVIEIVVDSCDLKNTGGRNAI